MDTEKIKELININPHPTLACAVAHYIAAYAGVTPREVGEIADEMKIKFSCCQLGLFGYGRKGQSDNKIIGRLVEVNHIVLERIMDKATEDKHVACKDLWDVAAQNKITRFEAGNAADSMGLKIVGCQLKGFF